MTEQGVDRGVAHVLVVDDEEVVHASLRKVLAKKGYKVDAVYSAEEGLDRLGSGSFDLVITDLMMPGMNGIELLRRIGEGEIHVPVIMITGYPTIRTAVQAMRLGARDYVSKPFTRKELLGPVLRALRHEESEDQPDRRDDIPEAEALLPGDVVYLAHHSWAQFQQDGMFLIGIERTFHQVAGDVVAISTVDAGDLVEQGAMGIRISNEANEEHGVAMPLTGQVLEVNRQALDDPSTVTPETWLLKLLPSQLADEAGNLNKR